MYYNVDYDERPLRLAEYILEKKSTVRETAAVFGISKSTVHKDLSVRLKSMSKPLYIRVRELLNNNLSQRHIRGGIATKMKYLKIHGIDKSE